MAQALRDTTREVGGYLMGVTMKKGSLVPFCGPLPWAPVVSGKRVTDAEELKKLGDDLKAAGFKFELVEVKTLKG